MSKLQKIMFIIAGVVLLSAGITTYILSEHDITDGVMIYILALVCATLGGFIVDILIVQSVVESITIYEYLEEKLGLDSPITKVFTCPKCFGFWSGLVGSSIMSVVFMIEFPFFILYVATMTWMCSVVNYVWFILMDKVRYGREVDYEARYNDLIENRRSQYDPEEGKRRMAKEAPKKKGCTTCGS